jgi:hypothetical protein
VASACSLPCRRRDHRRDGRPGTAGHGSGIHAGADAQAKFIDDFVAAWTKVMNLDRFDCR